MSDKKCLIIRLGGIGDLIFLTPIFPVLKQDGYEVHVNCKSNGKAIFKNNPFIDNLIIHDESIKIEDLPDHWKQLSQGYDKVINYSGSVEQKYLISDDNELYYGDKSKRKTDVNYYDEMFKLAGYNIKGRLPQLFINRKERKWLKRERDRHKGKFVILWSLSGSAIHKAWPYAEDVAKEILDKYPKVVIITAGDDFCYALEWEHPRTICTSGKATLRESLLRTSFVDLVIGAETGLINASGCWSVPKIILYTHSRHENLSKYFKNAYPIQSVADCSPCYRLVRPDIKNPGGVCNPVESMGRASACMVMIKPERVIDAVERVINP